MAYLDRFIGEVLDHPLQLLVLVLRLGAVRRHCGGAVRWLGGGGVWKSWCCRAEESGRRVRVLLLLWCGDDVRQSVVAEEIVCAGRLHRSYGH